MIEGKEEYVIKTSPGDANLVKNKFKAKKMIFRMKGQDTFVFSMGDDFDLALDVLKDMNVKPIKTQEPK
jgi:hypothetical protein